MCNGVGSAVLKCYGACVERGVVSSDKAHG